MRLPASRTPALGPRCVQVLLRGLLKHFAVLFSFPCCDWATHAHGTPVCPCLPALPAGTPVTGRWHVGPGGVAAHTGVLSPAGFLVDPGEDLLLSGVPTRTPRVERRHSRAVSESCQLWSRKAMWAAGQVVGGGRCGPRRVPPDLRCPACRRSSSRWWCGCCRAGSWCSCTSSA